MYSLTERSRDREIAYRSESSIVYKRLKHLLDRSCHRRSLILHNLMMIGVMILGIGCVEPVTSQEMVINPSVGGVSGGGEMSGGGSEGGGEGGMMINSDGRPQLMRIGDKVAVVGELLSIRLMASDPQNDVLSLAYGLRCRQGLSLKKIEGSSLGHRL